MFNLKTTTIAIASATLMATSVSALSLSVNAGVDSEADADSAQLSVTAGVSASAESDAATELFAGYEADADSEFMSNTVVSSDGAMLGQIDEVMVDAEGRQMVFINVDDSLDTDAERIYIVLGANLQSDGEISLDMTEAEFTSSLNAQVQG